MRKRSKPTGAPSAAPIPGNEAERLDALLRLRLAERLPEGHFEALCRAARSLFCVPTALISIVDADEQTFLGRCGFDQERTKRDVAFCAHAVMADEVLVVEDATRDPRFSSNPLVTGAPGIRFYAGAPLVLRPGIRLGTLCIIDTKPRRLSPEAAAQLTDLAAIAVSQLRLQEARLVSQAQATLLEERNQALAAREASLREAQELLVLDEQLADIGHWRIAVATLQVTSSAGFERISGREPVPGRFHVDDYIAAIHPDERERTREALMQLTAGKRESYDSPQRTRIVRPDGDIRVVVSRTVVERDAAGAVSSVFGVCMDMTESASAEDQLSDALKDSQIHHRFLTETVSDVIMRHSVQNETRYASPSSLEQLGRTPEEMLTRPFIEWVHPEDAAAMTAVIRDLRAGRLDRSRHTFRIQHKAGHWIWVEGRARLARDAKGVPAEIISSLRDVTERVVMDEHLRHSKERLDLVLDSGEDGLWDWNMQSGEIWRSGRFWDQLPARATREIDSCGLHWEDIHRDDIEGARLALRDHIEQRTAKFEAEFRLTARGKEIWAFSRGKVIERDKDGSPRRMVGTVIDITARKTAEARLAHIARHDLLTDLPNRAQFREVMGQRLAEVNRHGGTLAVLCLDIDRFKAVNDSLGYSSGDAVLREVAKRLRGTARLEDTVARLGGDEFAVLAHSLNATPPRRMDSLAERLIAAINAPLTIDGTDLTVGLTVGIAIAQTGQEDADALFQRADIALHRAKTEGRNKFRFFEAGIDEAMSERRSLELDLRNALGHNEFELFYQPVLDVGRDCFSGFEALIRWRHPTRGMVSPMDFIPIAEDTGLIVPLGDWILRTACHEAMSWTDSSLRLSVNVSAVQFRESGLLETIVSALAQSGLPAERLELEITESVLIGNGDAVMAIVQQIRAMGIRVALDDFGTGYSSLSYLHKFPFDRVKIDRSFVREIANPKTAAIVRATVDLADRLGMAITAEGIETAEQLELVRAEGVTEIQGYLISRPVAAEAVRLMLPRAVVERAA